MANRTDKPERWGVFAWTTGRDGRTLARINNTFTDEGAALIAAEADEFSAYYNKLVIPSDKFVHAWRLIGALVNDDKEDPNE